MRSCNPRLIAQTSLTNRPAIAGRSARTARNGRGKQGGEISSQGRSAGFSVKPAPNFTRTFDGLKVRLRDKYPDAAFERTLHTLRDHEAEERRESALNGLISTLAKSIVDDLIAEGARVNAEPDA